MDSASIGRASVAAGAPTRARPLLRAGRALAIACLWLALGSAIGVTAAIAVPSLLGMKALTVISGSMEPTLEVGSLVLDERIAPLEARRGDIVTFPDPSRGKMLVTHRVRSVRGEGTTAFFETRGDANSVSERWSVPTGGQIGRVKYHVPKLGYLRAFFTGPNARLAILGAFLLLGCWVIVGVWRRS